MKTMNFIPGVIPSVTQGHLQAMNGMAWYILGALIAFVLLGYLLYSLIKPEKF